MKYLRYLLLLVLFPTMVSAKVNSLEVVSVEQEEKSDDVEVIDEPVVEGSSISFNNRFYDVDDYIEYKIVMNNVSNEDIIVTNDYDNLQTKYFSYEVSIDADEKIVADQQVEVTLLVKYFEEVQREDIVSGHYVENQKINIGMVNGQLIVSEDEILDVVLPPNPLTKDAIVIFFIIAFIAAISLIIFHNKKIIKYSLVLLLFIPLYTGAVDSINVTSTVEIKLVKPNPCTYDGELVDNAKYSKDEYDYYYIEAKEGWRLSLRDKNTTDPVTSKICTTVNDKPIVSMNGTFYFANTTAIDLSSFDTSNVTDMSGMFGGARSVGEFDLITFDVRKVESMSSMFYYTSLKEYDVSSFETPSLKSVSSMFAYNEFLEELDVSNFDTSNVNMMSSFIDKTPALKKLNLSNWDFTNYDTPRKFIYISGSDISNITELIMDNVNFGTNMSGAFKNLNNLESISLKNVDTSRVTKIDEAFRGLSKLEEIDISGLDTSNIVNWSNSFADMSSLKHISAKGDVIKGRFKDMLSNTPIETIDLSDATLVGQMGGAFSGLSTLKSIDFTNTNTENVTGASYMFDGCSSLTSLDLSSWDTNNIHDMVGMFIRTPNLKEVDVSSFEFCSNPNLNYMFESSGIETLDLSSWDLTKLSQMPWGLVAKAESLVELDLTGLDFSNFSGEFLMGRMFGGSSYALAGGDYGYRYKLKKVDMTDAILPDGEGFFAYMPTVEELVLTNVDTSRMTTMRYMFQQDRNLKELDLSSFDTSNVTNMEYMFHNIQNIKTLDLSNFDTSKVINMGYMFALAKLETLNISSFDTSKVQNMEYMFGELSGLTALDLSSFVFAPSVYTRWMFNSIYVTVGYAKDQATVDFLNGIAPSTLTFSVKQ